jgi:NAD(P)H-hydrate epimerase
VASDTLCVGLVKRGLVQDAALANVGRLHRLDPGVPPKLINQLGAPAVLRVMAKDLETLPVPQDAPTAMKYQRGRVLLMAGSESYRGAALLAAHGAMASGVGSLKAALPDAVADAIWQWIPELVLSAGLPATASGGLAWGPWLADADLSRLDALLLGPGIGALDGQWDDWAEPLVAFEGLLVLDADGLNALADSKQGWRWLCRREFPTWITPHRSEFARLFPDFSGREPLDSAQWAAAESGTVVLHKGAHSVIADPNGVVHQLVDTSVQVARTGLGDLLAGFAVGWGARCWACGEEPRGTALAAAALLHAEASRTSKNASSASEIAKTLAELTRRICAN